MSPLDADQQKDAGIIWWTHWASDHNSIFSLRSKAETASCAVLKLNSTLARASHEVRHRFHRWIGGKLP